MSRTRAEREKGAAFRRSEVAVGGNGSSELKLEYSVQSLENVKSKRVGRTVT